MTTEKSTDVGIIVGRFQSPFIHEGHQEVIQKVISKHPRVVVFLGLSPHRCTRKDPYDFQIRKAMFEEQFPTVEVDYITDVGNDEVWSKNLDKQIRRVLGPNQTGTLYGSRDSFLKSYKGIYPTCELIPSKYISASDIRKQIGIKAKRTRDFREGIVYAMEHQPTRVIPTVDMAVLNPKTKELLMVRKTDESSLRFPGGKAETESVSYEADALRELSQEVGSKVSVCSPKYITSMLMDDWKFRGQYDKIKTVFFYCEYIGGDPAPEDDNEIAEARWVDVYKLHSTDIMPVHAPLVEAFLEYTGVFK
jgi:bifunctional NMN adenylyltransferase/nudix hydrolase